MMSEAMAARGGTCGGAGGEGGDGASNDAGNDAVGRLCPSGQPEMQGAEVFGLIDYSGDVATTTYLEERAAVTEELLELAAPLLPAQVFRFSATCQSQCIHWDERCSLVDRVVELLPVSSLTLPPCQIRADCRWFSQQGREACRRCPQVITQSSKPTSLMAKVARPPKAAEDARYEPVRTAVAVVMGGDPETGRSI